MLVVVSGIERQSDHKKTTTVFDILYRSQILLSDSNDIKNTYQISIDKGTHAYYDVEEPKYAK